MPYVLYYSRDWAASEDDAFEACWSQGMTFDEARAHVLREQRKTA